MGRTKGAKDRWPRRKKNVVDFIAFKDTKEKILKEGINHILSLAYKKGLHVDLWEILSCFKRIKNL